MRRYAQQYSAFETRSAEATNVCMLDVPDSSMYHLEAMSRRASGKIFTLDQCSIKATQSGFARSGSTGCAASDDEYVEQFATEPANIAADDRCGLHTSIIANSGRERRFGHTSCCAPRLSATPRTLIDRKRLQ